MKGSGEIEFFIDHGLSCQVLTKFFNSLSLAGHGCLSFTVLISDIDAGHKGFSNQTSCFPFIFKNHHDFARILQGRFVHEVRAFDDQAHGIFKSQHPRTKKSRVFPHTMADKIIRGEPFHGQTAADGSRGEKYRRLGILGGIKFLILSKHHLQQRISLDIFKNGLPFFHDRSNVGIGLEQFFHHTRPLGSLARKQGHHAKFFPLMICGMGSTPQYDVISRNGFVHSLNHLLADHWLTNSWLANNLLTHHLLTHYGRNTCRQIRG